MLGNGAGGTTTGVQVVARRASGGLVGEVDNELPVLYLKLDDGEPASVPQRLPGLEIELPPVPGAVQDLAVASIDVLARRRRKCCPAHATDTYRRPLMRAEILIGDEPVAQIEDADLNAIDRYDFAVAASDFGRVADRIADALAAQPTVLATGVASTVRAGRPYHSRAFVSKMRSAHSSFTGK